MAKRIIRDIVIVGVAILVIWIGAQIAFGAQNPLYVVASGSMIPVLQVNDILVVQGDCFDFWGLLDPKTCIVFGWYTPFEDIEIGDIIVFDRPSDHNRVIVHRVVSIIDDEPKTIRTKGDANTASIPGTDFPITEKEYIGKLAYTIPQVGVIPKLLSSNIFGIPVNFVLIAIVIGAIIANHMSKKKKEKELPFSDPLDSNNLDTVEGLSEKQDVEEFSDTNKMRKDSEYLENKTEITDEKKIEESTEEESKTDKKTSKKDKKE